MGNDKISKIIESSGNDFHYEVAEFFKKKEWKVKISPYYNDFVTNKPREIDIIAEKEYPVRGTEKIKIRLFIECKFLKYPIILWFDSKNLKEAKKLAKENDILSGKEDSVLKNESRLPPKIHHYIQDGEVVKLSAKIEGSDVFYEAMNQTLNASIFFSENKSTDRYTIDYPLIVVDSFKNLYRREKSVENGSSPISDNFQIEIDYSYLNKEKKDCTKYFLIDVISFDKFNDFLEQLEQNDIAILQNILLWDSRYQREQNRRQEKAQDLGLDSYDI